MNLKPLDHPNIVKMHELYIDLEKNQIFLIMDYVQAKEMFKMLKKNGSYTGKFFFFIFAINMNFNIFFGYNREFSLKNFQTNSQCNTIYAY